MLLAIVLSHFLGEGCNFLVNLLPEVLEDLLHLLLVGFDVTADVSVCNNVGELHYVKCHAPFNHEDGFFGTERLVIGFFHNAFHSPELTHGEVASWVFLDGVNGYHGCLESFLGLVLLFHKADGVLSSGNLNPHSVVPDLASKIEDLRNFSRYLLRLVALVMLFGVMLLVAVVLGMLLGFLSTFLGFVMLFTLL